MREKYLFIDKPLSDLKEEIKGAKKPVFKRLYELARTYKEEFCFLLQQAFL